MHITTCLCVGVRSGVVVAVFERICLLYLCVVLLCDGFLLCGGYSAWRACCFALCARCFAFVCAAHYILDRNCLYTLV